MIEVTLQAVGSNVEYIEGSDQARLTIAGGIGFPTPQGLAMIPGVAMHSSLTREAAEMIHKQLGEVIEQMPKQTDLSVARSMADVEKVAQRQSIIH